MQLHILISTDYFFLKSCMGASMYDVCAEGGVKKFTKFADEQYRFCRQRVKRGPIIPIVCTSYMKAPMTNFFATIFVATGKPF